MSQNLLSSTQGWQLGMLFASGHTVAYRGWRGVWHSPSLRSVSTTNTTKTSRPCSGMLWSGAELILMGGWAGGAQPEPGTSSGHQNPLCKDSRGHRHPTVQTNKILKTLHAHFEKSQPVGHPLILITRSSAELWQRRKFNHAVTKSNLAGIETIMGFAPQPVKFF